MDSFRFEHLDNDIKIQALGSFFRLESGSQWSINIGFFPFQDKSNLRISNAPVLARQRFINPTQQYKSTGIAKDLIIIDTSEWQIGKIKNCPALQKVKNLDAEQNCFVFKGSDSTTIYLPQFELARALFFHDSYISRTALEPEFLTAEFDVQIDREADRATINVMPSAGYSLKHFQDVGARRFLSWILIDEEARKSYESIGKHQKINGIKKGNYRLWDFSFDPPLLPAAKLSVRGFIDTKNSCMFVYEIYGIYNIKADVPSEVDFFHPLFIESMQGSKKGSSAGGKIPTEHHIHDGATPSTDIQPYILRAETLVLEFDKPIKTNRVADKKESIGGGKKAEDETEFFSKDVSTDESDTTGDLPGADWDNIDDQTDDAQAYENKFSCFFNMIEELKIKHGCDVTAYPLRKLPHISKCTKHLLSTDFNPRCLAVVKITALKQDFIVLEVDTSDAEKSLSTKLLSLKSPSSFGNDLKILEEKFLQGSLLWPTKFLDDICGKGNHHGIPHPKSIHQGVIDPDSVSGWAARFYAKIVEIGGSK